MNIHVTIEHDDLGLKRYQASIKTTDLFHYAFEPISTVDPGFAIFSPEAISEEACEKVIKLRKNAAQNIAKELSEYLIKVMSAEDTHNGYKLIRS